MITCSLCGRQEPEGTTTLTWTTSVEHGQRRSYCATCSREHVRSMEGKLDAEHW